MWRMSLSLRHHLPRTIWHDDSGLKNFGMVGEFMIFNEPRTPSGLSLDFVCLKFLVIAELYLVGGTSSIGCMVTCVSALMQIDSQDMLQGINI
jgi:hypothetical protein